MSTTLTTWVISRLAIASIEFLVLGLIVFALLAIFRGISPVWRRRIWLLVMCKPAVTILSGAWGGLVPMPSAVSSSLLHEMLFPFTGADGVVGPEGAAGQVVYWLAHGWLAVTVLCLIRVWRQTLGSQRFVDSALEKGYLLKPTALRRLDPNLVIPPAARVIVTPEDDGPVTVGIRHPAIIIPESLLPWVIQHRDPTPEERDRLVQIICHELVHVANRDYVLSLLANVMMSLFWFHPAAHLAYRRFRINSELCCDMEVVERGADPVSYADTLLNVVASRFTRKGFALRMVGDIAPAQVLRRRLHYMLTDLEQEQSKRQTVAYLVLLLVLASMPRYLAEGSSDLVDVILADGQIRQVRESEVAALVQAGARLAGSADYLNRAGSVASGAFDTGPSGAGAGIPFGAGELASIQDASDEPGIAEADITADDEQLARIDENGAASESADEAQSEKDRTRRSDWLRTLGLNPEEPNKPLLPRRDEHRQP